MADQETQEKPRIISNAEWHKAIIFRDQAIRRANEKDDSENKRIARRHAEAMSYFNRRFIPR